MNYFNVPLGIYTIQKILKELPMSRWQFDAIKTLKKNRVNYYEIRRRKRNNIVLRQ
jgi:hypothetical protein